MEETRSRLEECVCAWEQLPNGLRMGCRGRRAGLRLVSATCSCDLRSSCRPRLKRPFRPTAARDIPITSKGYTGRYFL